MYKFNSTVLSPSARTTGLDHVQLTGWLSQQMRTEVVFTSHFDERIAIYWHSEAEGDGPVRTMDLEQGDEVGIQTFLGHVFSARKYTEKQDGPGELLDWMSISEDAYAFSKSRMETCELVPGSVKAKAHFTGAEGAEISCEDTEMRFAEFLFNVYYTKRLGLNYVQPQMVPAVTDSGFLHTKLPADTFAWLLEWYEANKEMHAVLEHSVGPCMNQHVSESIMTHLPQHLKDQLSLEVAPILKDWYGGELHLTSIYGVRKYTDGAVLRMHVDTVNTHVVSAIINVGQRLREDWPLLILDHDDAEHSISMQPGDMVLYESAKLLHGRPSVFQGDAYENIFIHYAPTEGWDYNWV
jgi:hypothetical protein